MFLYSKYPISATVMGYRAFVSYQNMTISASPFAVIEHLV